VRNSTSTDDCSTAPAAAAAADPAYGRHPIGGRLFGCRRCGPVRRARRDRREANENSNKRYLTVRYSRTTAATRWSPDFSRINWREDDDVLCETPTRVGPSRSDRQSVGVISTFILSVSACRVDISNSSTVSSVVACVNGAYRVRLSAVRPLITGDDDDSDDAAPVVAVSAADVSARVPRQCGCRASDSNGLNTARAVHRSVVDVAAAEQQQLRLSQCRPRRAARALSFARSTLLAAVGRCSRIARSCSSGIKQQQRQALQPRPAAVCTSTSRSRRQTATAPSSCASVAAAAALFNGQGSVWHRCVTAADVYQLPHS